MAEDVKINISVNMQTDSVKKDTKDVNNAINSVATNATRASNTQVKAEQSVNKARKDTLKTTMEASVELKKIAQSTFSEVKNIAVGTLTALGLDKIFGNINESLSTALSDASSIVESENLLRSTFNEGATSMLAWADASATAYGITNIQAKKYLSFITGVLNNTGVANDELQNMATNYVRVVGDLASAFNTEVSDAFEAIRSGIAGNTTAMQRYGVVLSVANLQQFLNEKGIEATYKSLDATSKQYVRYAYIMKSTADIQGDYTNTFTSFSNTLRTLQGDWKNLLALIGQYAIPMIQPVITALSTVIAYAKAVVEYLAELFGWEKYTSDSVDYSYLIKDNTEDTADAQEDVTKAVKETNKEMKKGVKLLDLYTLDFSSNSKVGTANTGIDTSPVQDIKGLLDDVDYNIPDKILPKIDVDMSVVEKIGNAIKGIYDNFINPFIIKPVSKVIDFVLQFLETDLVTKFRYAIQVISTFLTIQYFKPILTRLFTNALVLMKTFFTSGSYWAAILGAIGGLFLGGIGGWGLGESIAKSLREGEPDIIGAVTSIGTIIAGIGIAFIASGPFAAAMAAISAFIFSITSAIFEVQKDYDYMVETILDGSVELDTIFASYAPVEELEAFNTAAESTQTSMNEINKSTGDALKTIQNLGSDPTFTLYANGALSDKMQSLSIAYGNIADSAQKYIDTVSKPVSNALIDSLTGDGGILAGAQQTNEELKNTLNTMLELQSQDISGASKQLQELMAKENKTDEDVERIKTLQTRIELFAAETQDTTNIVDAFREANITSIDDLIATSDKLVDDYNKNTESIIKDYERYSAYYASVASDTTLSDKQREDAEASKKYWDAMIDTVNIQRETYASEVSKAQIDFSRDLKDELDNRALSVVANVYLKERLADNISVSQDQRDYFKDTILSQANMTAFQYATEVLKLPASELAALDEAKIIDISFMSHVAYTGLTTDSSRIRFGDFSDTAKNALMEVYNTAGFTSYFDTDGLLTVDYPSSITNKIDNLNTDYELKKEDVRKNLTDAISGIKPIIESATKDEVENSVSSGVTSGISDGLSDGNSIDVTKTAIEANLVSALEDVETPDEAKEKGTELANAITGGITDGFNTSLAAGSDFSNAVIKLKNTLSGITTDFENAFKSSLNSIADYINTLSSEIKNQAKNLNIKDGELTVSNLINALSSSNFHIPALANGGVIPPGNPFLAVLGDQSSGTNIEAPVTVIKDAVRDVITDSGNDTPVEVRVYIGDREIRDFVIDTITSNNLIVG